jgi:hypothetical protein
MKPAASIVEDIDLVQQNPQRSLWQKANEYTEAIQVDNPYTVMLEVRGSRDGGGPIVMRVPAQSTRILTVRVRDISLRALGQPAGVIPTTLVRFDRPMPNGIYSYGQGAALTIASVIGSSLSGVADDGSAPVKVGGRFNLALPTLTDGMRGDLQLGSRGSLNVQLLNANSTVSAQVLTTSIDAITTANGALEVLAKSALFNGSTWDRARTAIIFKNVAGVAVVAGTPVSVWTPAAGKKFRLMGAVMMATAGSAIIVKDTSPVEIMRLPAQGPGAPTNLGNGYLSSAANNQLFLDLTASGAVHGVVFGTEE